MFKQIKKLKEKIHELEEEREELQERLQARHSIEEMVEESIPKNPQERQAYMAKVTGFYGEVFKDQLKYLISLQKDLLSEYGKSEKVYDILRSNIDCFQVIMRWCERCRVEHLGNVQEKRQEIENLKE